MTSRRRPHFLFFFFPAAFLVTAVIAWFVITGKPDPRAAQVHADFTRILEALDGYRAEHGSLPEEGDLSFLVPRYLDAEPKDPWGHAYVYASNGERPFLQSLGADGYRGGNGPNEDHTNHDGHSVLGVR